jgi:hypothetical protein
LYPHWVGVADDGLAWHVYLDGHSARFSLGAHLVNGGTDESGDIGWFALQFYLIAYDPRQVEQVFDQLQELICVSLDRLNSLTEQRV